MNLLIFIGHFKTGSSSLQSFLTENFLTLLRAGILYPSVESMGVAHNMRVLRDGHDLPARGLGLNIREPHNALALRLKKEEDGHRVPKYHPRLPGAVQMLELISNQIDSLQPQTVILCSEVFALLGLTEKRNAIARLVEKFPKTKVTIYCNLRRPDDHIASWHRQRFKFGAKLAPLSDGGLEGYLDTAHFQQAAMIRGWIEERFTKARLIVRNFEEVKAAGGTVVDFIARSGAVFPADLAMPADLNPSVPNALSEVARRANHYLPREQSRPLIRRLTLLPEEIELPHDKEVEMYGPAMRQLLAERFAPVAADLDALTGRSPFYPDLAEIARQRPLPEAEATAMALETLLGSRALQSFPKELRTWLKGLDLGRKAA